MSPIAFSRPFLPYAAIAFLVSTTMAVAAPFAAFLGALEAANQHTFSLFVLAAMVAVFTVGFIVYELARLTVIPSFVLAIIFGIAARDLLSFVIQNPTALTTLIMIGAVLVLFGGGLDTPFRKFKSLIGPILSLALIGTLINAYLLSGIIEWAGSWFGYSIPLAAAVVLGAAIASTDPAAIIPCFSELRFKKPSVKHIAISESAINDVIGAVLVVLLILMLKESEVPFASVNHVYLTLFSWQSLLRIGQALLVGTISGFIGSYILQTWSSLRASGNELRETGSDAALFLAVPLFSFVVAELFQGSGFLAVFMAGLLFQVQAHFRHIEHYFEHTVEGFMKPMIFMLLGALVNPTELLNLAPLGITLGLITIVVLRPLIVLLTLAPFHFYGKNKLSWRELAFLSFVRETGVIPAALLVTIKLTGIPGSEYTLTLGLWIILITLAIQPPLTPWVAQILNIATCNNKLPSRQHHGPVAVLCSRGNSFPERMKTVVRWAQQHSVDNIALLHCPEEKYTDAYREEHRQMAEKIFFTINQELENDGSKPLNFEFIGGPGLLQDNIEQLVASGDVAIIFVGSRMLDYRMEDVKKLAVPFYFMT